MITNGAFAVMSDIAKKLVELNIQLPVAAAAAANYVPYVITGNQLFISGQIPFLDGKLQFIGKVGETITFEQAADCARLCAINLLAQASHAIDGDWSRLIRLVKITGFVNCIPTFDQHPKVVNGASDLLVGVLGERGRHARSSVGVSSLPFNVAVEVEAVFEITA